MCEQAIKEAWQQNTAGIEGLDPPNVSNLDTAAVEMKVEANYAALIAKLAKEKKEKYDKVRAEAKLKEEKDKAVVASDPKRLLERCVMKVVDKHFHAGDDDDDDMEEDVKPPDDSLADDFQHLVKAIKSPNISSSKTKQPRATAGQRVPNQNRKANPKQIQSEAEGQTGDRRGQGKGREAIQAKKGKVRANHRRKEKEKTINQIKQKGKSNYKGKSKRKRKRQKQRKGKRQRQMELGLELGPESIRSRRRLVRAANWSRAQHLNRGEVRAHHYDPIVDRFFATPPWSFLRRSALVVEDENSLWPCVYLWSFYPIHASPITGRSQSSLASGLAAGAV
jgi:hypothetical protein